MDPLRPMPSLRCHRLRASPSPGLLWVRRPASAEAQVRIGLSAPLTGPDAAFGQGLRLGAEQAVADLNRAGGVNGQRLVLVVADDAGDGKQGLAVARRFAAERVGLVVGPFNAAVAGLALPAYEEAGIVAVTPGTGFAGPDGQGPLERLPHRAERRRAGSARRRLPRSAVTPASASASCTTRARSAAASRRSWPHPQGGGPAGGRLRDPERGASATSPGSWRA